MDDREVGSRPGCAGSRWRSASGPWPGGHAFGLVSGEPDGQIRGDADHVSQARNRRAAAPRFADLCVGLVAGDAHGDRAAVAGPVAAAGGIEAGLPGGAGGSRGRVGVDGLSAMARPALPGGVEAVQPGRVAQAVRAAPGMQRIGEVLVSLVAVRTMVPLSSGVFAGVDGFLCGRAALAARKSVRQRGHNAGARRRGRASRRRTGPRRSGAVTEPVHERAEPGVGPAADPAVNPADARAGQRGDQPGSAGAGGVARAPAAPRWHGPGPVAAPPVTPADAARRWSPRTPGTASPAPGLRAPPAAGKRGLERLPFLHAGGRDAGQVISAAAAHYQPGCRHRGIGAIRLLRRS